MMQTPDGGKILVFRVLGRAAATLMAFDCSVRNFRLKCSAGGLKIVRNSGHVCSGSVCGHFLVGAYDGTIALAARSLKLALQMPAAQEKPTDSYHRKSEDQ